MKKIGLLLPYAPVPVRTGAQAEMRMHMDVLKELGALTIYSARRRPVGAGWSEEVIRSLADEGIACRFREDDRKNGIRQWLGMGYGALFTGLRLPGAFGPGNPYHASAFPPDWWRSVTAGLDLAVVYYAHWSSIPTACPQAVVLSDLLSRVMWTPLRQELARLRDAELIHCIACEEVETLKKAGYSKARWSPLTFARPEDLGDAVPERVGLVGSSNRFNQEGFRWLRSALRASGLPVHVYGSLGRVADAPSLRVEGGYADPWQPYRDCGIVLIPTSGGTGTQVKCLEALTAGRVILCRRGAMRGIPREKGAWLEMDSPVEMLALAEQFRKDAAMRRAQAANARAYAEAYLGDGAARRSLRASYAGLIGS